MKKALFLLGIFCISLNSLSQEIGIQVNYAGSSYNKFMRNWGYGLEYNDHITTKSRIGVLIQHSFCNTDYSEVYPDSDDGVSTIIRSTSPKNQRLAFKVNYAYKVVDHGIAGLYIGPEIGINYMIIKESVRRIENGSNSAANYTRDYSVNNRLSFGLLIEFELKEVIAKRISSYLSFHPEMISLTNGRMDGGNTPWMIRWMGFSFGFRYNLKPQK